ncbi:MAG: tyrosine-type recombinase/integrase [Bacilli bacterium]|nr:tyrosine-type recombinase/integrase [Bacilli bacterium]
MNQTKLLRNEIVDVCRNECSKYGLSINYSSIVLIGSRTLVFYMQEKQVEVYSLAIGQEFREYIHTVKSKKYADQLCRSIDILNAYVNSDLYVFKRPSLAKTFPGEFGPLAIQYMQYLRDEIHCRPATIKHYEFSLNMFCIYSGISSFGVNSLKLDYLLDFFSTVQNMKASVVQCVKGFMHYLTDNKIIKYDLGIDNIKPSKFRRERLPSFYSKEEVLLIEKQIDRASVVGKRDYAMMLLASRLGLRSSDIRKLQFSNINWDKNEITIMQDKTKKTVVLPLLEDVGSAIIDYVVNARPDTNEKYVFVSFRPPYRVITASTFSVMIAKNIYKSGVECKGKHHGSHALRHSLATNLLEGNVSLPVISSVLGHSSTESTKVYLSVDIQSLLYCSHDVPEVKDGFYQQGGGEFYV